jgi:hypothetical protein
MKHLRQLAVAFVLTIALTVNAFAGELQTPPCASPLPGELQTPPCVTYQLPPDDSETAQTSEVYDTSATSLLTETAIDLLVSMISLY